MYIYYASYDICMTNLRKLSILLIHYQIVRHYKNRVLGFMYQKTPARTLYLYGH
jgi:hypothetical protein